MLDLKGGKIHLGLSRGPWPQLYAASLLAILSGCFASQPSKPVMEFPKPAELQGLTTAPAPAIASAPEMANGNGWRFAGPLPDEFPTGAWQPTSEAESHLAMALQAERQRIRFTQSMACVARELGMFYASEGKPPQNEWKTFVLAICGATPPQFDFGTVQADVSAGSDAQVAEASEASFRLRVRQTFAQTAPQALDGGVWIGRHEGKVTMVFVAGQPLAEILHGEWTPNAEGQVRFEGRSLMPAAYVTAHINQGPFGVRPCLVDISTAMPNFRVTCPMHSFDETAFLEVYYTAKASVFERPLFHALARRKGPPAIFVRDGYGLSGVGGDQEFKKVAEESNSLIALMNKLRARAQLKPVLPAPGEMENAQALLPYMLLAAQGNDEAKAEKLALGLLAGWRTEGMIRDGRIVIATASPSRTSLEWLTNALQTPIGRITLMVPETEQVSVGVVLGDDPSSLTAVVTGWSFHHGSDHHADVVSIYKRIIAARQRLHLPQVQRLALVTGMVEHLLNRVHEGKETPMGALEGTLQLGTERYGANMRGYVLEASTLEAIQIPEEILAQPELALEVGVTHHKPPGAAWAQFVVIIAYIDESRVAARPHEPQRTF